MGWKLSTFTCERPVINMKEKSLRKDCHNEKLPVRRAGNQVELKSILFPWDAQGTVAYIDILRQGGEHVILNMECSFLWSHQSLKPDDRPYCGGQRHFRCTTFCNGLPWTGGVGVFWILKSKVKAPNQILPYDLSWVTLGLRVPKHLKNRNFSWTAGLPSFSEFKTTDYYNYLINMTHA